MKLFLYRISLTETDQDDLFEAKRDISRQDFLKENFERSFVFSSWGSVSLRYEFTQVDDEVIAGAVCRWLPEDSEADPVDPFATVEGGRWIKAAFFFNIEEHQQVFGIEHNQRVGSPSAIISGILKELNSRSHESPYLIEVFGINDRGTFYESIDRYPGKITTLTFKFVVPNPPDVEKQTIEALKKLGKQTGAEEATETLKSSRGLKTGSDYVHDAVKYIEDGGGEVVAKDGNETVYNSENVVKVAKITEDARPTGGFIQGISEMVKGLLRK